MKEKVYLIPSTKNSVKNLEWVAGFFSEISSIAMKMAKVAKFEKMVELEGIIRECERILSENLLVSKSVILAESLFPGIAEDFAREENEGKSLDDILWDNPSDAVKNGEEILRVMDGIGKKKLR